MMLYISQYSLYVDLLVASENFERTIANFDQNFSRLLLELLEKIMEYSCNNGEPKLYNILYR
jgi:hypothetical protein